MREEQFLEKEWAKHPQIPTKARKLLENLFRRKYGIEGEVLAEQIGVFVEGHEITGHLIEQFRNEYKSGETHYEKALRRSVRLVRFVHNVIASKRLNPSRIDWSVVWQEYNKANPKSQMKSPKVLKARYYQVLANPRVKKKLFDKEYSENSEAIREIIVLAEDPDVAEQTMKAAFYDTAREYGAIQVSGTVIVTRAQMGLAIADEKTIVDFSKDTEGQEHFPKIGGRE